MDGPVAGAADALARCPFLHRVCQQSGESAAMLTALAERGLDLGAALRLWHGPGGVVPLKRLGGQQDDAARPGPPPGCPFHRKTEEVPAGRERAPARPCRQPLGGAPLASISMGFSFLGDPGKFFRTRLRRRPRKQRRPQPQGGGAAGPGGPGNAAGGPKPRPGKPGGRAPTARSASSTSRLQPPSQGASGRCPMRDYLGGGLGGLLPAVGRAGHLECPPAIIKMRAAVAALRPVRGLRPHALPVRSLGLGATAVLLNVPCGAWREHTRKFSPAWFLAVHATIPFVAMLRKAVLMPPWAVLLTVAGAVAGQAAGARLERARLAAAASGGGAAPAAAARRGPLLAQGI